MGAATLTIPTTEERRSRRVPFRGEIEYRYGDNESGKAQWCSVGREGACIRIGRYLRPGRHIRVECHGLDLEARVI